MWPRNLGANNHKVLQDCIISFSCRNRCETAGVSYSQGGQSV